MKFAKQFKINFLVIVLKLKKLLNLKIVPIIIQKKFILDKL